jgi:RNA polymerase sigma factor (TIGR02999 family)
MAHGRGEAIATLLTIYPTIGSMPAPDLPPRDDHLVDLLVQALYPDLKRLARRERGRAGHPAATLGTTALVHEAYLKLARSDAFQSQAHFLNTAALAMRQVLVTHARARLRHKRNPGQAPLDVDDVEVLAESDERIVALDEALLELEQHAPRLARIVECRYFAGYSDAETALALDLSERTVQRDWAMAKALLYEALDS